MPAVDANGTVQLHRERFQEKFPDGTAVAELRAAISNGFLHLTRKDSTHGKLACSTPLAWSTR